MNAKLLGLAWLALFDVAFLSSAAVLWAYDRTVPAVSVLVASALLGAWQIALTAKMKMTMI